MPATKTNGAKALSVRRNPSNPVTSLILLAVVCGGGYLAYKKGLFSLLTGDDTSTDPTTPPLGQPPGGQPPSRYRPPSGCTGNIAAMKTVNANFESQMGAWQTTRKARGENQYDWSAFTSHLIGIGAPYPGDTPPSAFCSFT
jgi:hypothetical protein